MTEITRQEMIDWLNALDEGATIWDTDLPMIDAIRGELAEADGNVLPELPEGWRFLEFSLQISGHFHVRISNWKDTAHEGLGETPRAAVLAAIARIT